MDVEEPVSILCAPGTQRERKRVRFTLSPDEPVPERTVRRKRIAEAAERGSRRQHQRREELKQMLGVCVDEYSSAYYEEIRQAVYDAVVDARRPIVLVVCTDADQEEETSDHCTEVDRLYYWPGDYTLAIELLYYISLFDLAARRHNELVFRQMHNKLVAACRAPDSICGWTTFREHLRSGYVGRFSRRSDGLAPPDALFQVSCYEI